MLYLLVDSVENCQRKDFPDWTKYKWAAEMSVKCFFEFGEMAKLSEVENIDRCKEECLKYSFMNPNHPLGVLAN